MTDVNQLIIKHLLIWTSATKKKSSAGRGNGGAVSLYGIKKLRELILELAVRGRLVPQHMSEGAGHDLVKECLHRREKLVSSKEIKKTKTAKAMPEEFVAFEGPLNWSMTQLGDLAYQITDGTHHTPKYQETGAAFISVKDIDGKTVSFEDCKYISPEEHQAINQRCNPEFGDLLICRIGTLGRATIVDTERPFSLFVSVGLIKTFQDLILPAYLHLALNSPFLVRQFDLIKAGGSHTNKLNLGDLPSLIIPVPPTAEQHRIVAKVDELMGLCDALETQTEDSLKAHQTLVETCLATLTNSQTPEDLTQNWTRIETHFDTLFTTEESLDLLWKFTLKLAIRGDLVSQEPSDQRACELVSEIRKAKEAMVSEGKLRKAKALIPIKEEEMPFPLKKGWIWVRLNDFIDVRDGTHDSPKDAVGSDTFPLVTSKNFQNGAIDFETARRISAQDHQEISKRSFVERDDILFSMIGGNLGNQVIVKTDQEFSVKNVALFKYYDKSKSLPDFVKLYMENLAVDLQRQASGGAQPFVSLGFLRNLLIAVPPFNEQERIVRKARSVESIISFAKAEISMSSLKARDLANTLTSKIH